MILSFRKHAARIEFRIPLYKPNHGGLVEHNWPDIQALLRRQIAPNAFNIWIRPIRLLDLKEDTITLGCPNKFFIRWVKDNYLGMILDAFNALTSRDYHIDFKVDVPEKKSSDQVEDKQLSLPSISTGYRGRRLFNNFTFDQFIVGGSNHLAYSVAWALATNQATFGDTLYFFSDTGLGKSHLTQAIGSHILRENPGIRLFYLTAEEFTNEMVYCLKRNQIEAFKEKYRRNCDVLMLEEIYFLSGKEKTQTELTYTLDALYSENKKIVFTSPYLPEHIPQLGKGLRSRLRGGLITHIGPPDYETRVKILKKKASNYDMTIPDEVIEYLADCINGDVRQLESSLIGLLARSSLLNEPIDLAMARESLKGIVGKKKGTITIDAIQALTCSYYKISLEEIKSKSRKRPIVLCRDISMYFSRSYTRQPLEVIGKAFNRDHATVIHGIRAIEMEIQRRGKIYYQIEFLSKQLQNMATLP